MAIITALIMVLIRNMAIKAVKNLKWVNNLKSLKPMSSNF